MLYTYRGTEHRNRPDFGHTYAGTGRALEQRPDLQGGTPGDPSRSPAQRDITSQGATCSIKAIEKDNLDLLLQLVGAFFGEGWGKVEISRDGQADSQVGWCVRVQKATARTGGSGWEVREVVYERADRGLPVDSGDPEGRRSVPKQMASKADPYGLNNPSEDMLALLYLG